MSFTIWALIIGVLLITMVLSGTLLKRLPVSTGMLYLAAGYALGPAGWDLVAPHPLADAAILERMAEVTVLILLFATGLKLGLPLAHRHWRWAWACSVCMIWVPRAGAGSRSISVGRSPAACWSAGLWGHSSESWSFIFGPAIRKLWGWTSS